MHLMSMQKFHRRSNLLGKKKKAKEMGPQHWKNRKQGRLTPERNLSKNSSLVSSFSPRLLAYPRQGPTRPDLSFRPAQVTSFPPNSATHHRLLAMATRIASTTQLHFVGRWEFSHNSTRIELAAHASNALKGLRCRELFVRERSIELRER